ncbi:glycoside hydrolase family protein [Escherichia coli]|nr:glycoside hydrolase family protein [Escherichia coli]
MEGLKLIADYEGCRLQPYQCSAGVWTDGIGNTSGVIPGKTITERQAAEGLISNVLRVERALERCVKQQPPQKVYDAAVSFAFKRGYGQCLQFHAGEITQSAALGGCVPTVAALGLCERCF